MTSLSARNSCEQAATNHVVRLRPRNTRQAATKLKVVNSKSATISTDLHERGQAFDRLAIPDNTRRAYKAAWADFAAWCQDHNATALPATPSSVAAYLTDRSDLKRSTLQLRLAAISKAHQAQDLPSPTRSPDVAYRMRGIKTAKAIAGETTTKKRPIVKSKLESLIDKLPDTLQGKRDKALLLIGFFGALRRSEICRLECKDANETSNGLELTLRLSKTDKDASGLNCAICFRGDALCPVAALNDWLAAADIQDGSVFRSINKAGQISGKGLSGNAVALIIKKHMEANGLDPADFSGHSLRAGFVTECFSQGIAPHDTARQTRHKSMVVLNGYDRRGAFENNVTASL